MTQTGSTQTDSETPWWWRLEAADGSAVEPAEARQEFPTRADAESWVGECYQDLTEQGAVAVTLFEGERQVYGPMSLLPG